MVAMFLLSRKKGRDQREKFSLFFKIPRHSHSRYIWICQKDRHTIAASKTSSIIVVGSVLLATYSVFFPHISTKILTRIPTTTTTMTRVKLTSSSSNHHKSTAATLSRIALISFVVLVIVGSALWSIQPTPSQHQIRNGNDLSSLVAHAEGMVKEEEEQVAAVVNSSAQQQRRPGVHRYEMTLARLVADGTSDGSKTTGKVILETYDDWAPLGVAHFHQLVTTAAFYDQCRFFRVVDNFVVQFGINGDPAVQRQWRNDVLRDDPVVETNAYGTFTYATSGPHSRTTQLFINTNPHGNGRLDGMGFAPLGRVVSGMDDVISRINNEYHEQPNQGKIQNQGNAYLDRDFPRLTYIESLRSLDDTDEGMAL